MQDMAFGCVREWDISTLSEEMSASTQLKRRYADADANKEEEGRKQKKRENSWNRSTISDQRANYPVHQNYLVQSKEQKTSRISD